MAVGGVVAVIVSEGFAVFALVLVVEHGEVGLVAALGDKVLLDGF